MSLSKLDYMCAVNVLGRWCKTRIIFHIRMLINIHLKLCVLYLVQWVTNYIENFTGAFKKKFAGQYSCLHD